MSHQASSPGAAREMLDRAEAADNHNRIHDTWPLALIYLGLPGPWLVALVALPVLGTGPEVAVVTVAATAWLLPVLAVYVPFARSWKKGAGARYMVSLGLLMFVYLGGIFLGAELTVAYYVAAGLLFVLAPALALLEFRK